MTTLVVENGQGLERTNSFVTLDEAREYYLQEFGFEHLSCEGNPFVPDLHLERALKAAFKYMVRMPWAGYRTRPYQGGSWPRILYETDYYRYYKKDYRHADSFHGWLPLYETQRNCVAPLEIPDRIRECHMILTRDIVDGYLDPTGRLKPVVTRSISSEAGSMTFHRPQALAAGPAGMQVRSRDPLYAVRELVSPWLRVRVMSVRMRRG